MNIGRVDVPKTAPSSLEVTADIPRSLVMFNAVSKISSFQNFVLGAILPPFQNMKRLICIMRYASYDVFILFHILVIVN